MYFMHRIFPAFTKTADTRTFINNLPSEWNYQEGNTCSFFMFLDVSSLLFIPSRQKFYAVQRAFETQTWE